MPELTVPPLKTVALSEPQWRDGWIWFAAETPLRDAIRLYRQDVGVERFELVATFPGGPTDNGIRAQWPRFTGNALVYQRGEVNVLHFLDGSGVQRTLGPAHGIWPVAVKTAFETFQAPPTTSQGVFGYLDGKWWTFDEIWLSPYAAAYPKGVLFHGWRDFKGVLWLVFKSNEQTILVNDIDGKWNRYVVFEGHAEYPRGCSLPDGRVYMHAVGADGSVREALGPFPKLEEVGVANVTIPGWVDQGTAPFTAGFSYLTTAAVRAWKRVRPVGDLTWAEEPVLPSGTFTSVTLINPGQYELSMRAEGVDGVSVETGARRVITVLAPPVPPPPAPQVMTKEDENEIYQFSGKAVAEADTHLPYINARAAGLDHRAALVAYRDAMSAAIAQLEV